MRAVVIILVKAIVKATIGVGAMKVVITVSGGIIGLTLSILVLAIVVV